MQKIIIKNFRAIEYAEIELKKVLVLIGAQATGKSTIAKLIYFFKTIQDDFFVQVYENGDTNLEKLIKRKFIEFLGDNDLNFEIKFWINYDENKFFSVYRKEENLKISLSNIINESSINKLKSLKDEIINSDNLHRIARRSRIAEAEKSLSNKIDEVFDAKQRNNLYVIAGRNVTVTYSEIFNNFLDKKIELRLRKNQKNIDSTDEILMSKFIEEVNYLKTRFKFMFGGTFNNIKRRFEEIDIDLVLIEKVVNQIEKILKAKYQIKGDSEQIIIENGKSKIIALTDASSGQQEVIRILQDLFFLIFNNQKFLRIIEEPEAHLFPIAQKELIELLALAVNHQRENQLIIATHSPYILTVFNNLLFANRVVEKNPDAKEAVEAIIESDFWLKAEDFSAYSLGKDSEDNLYCRSIVNPKTGMIQQNYLDEVSEILGARFNALFDIYKKSGKRRRR